MALATSRRVRYRPVTIHAIPIVVRCVRLSSGDLYPLDVRGPKRITRADLLRAAYAIAEASTPPRTQAMRFQRDEHLN